MNFDWSYFKTFEPALLRGFWVSLVALLATLGYTISEKVNAEVTAVIAVLVVVVPILQAYWTRSAVVPQARSDALVQDALYLEPPGAAPDITHADVADPSVPTPVDPPPTTAIQDDGSPADPPVTTP